MMFLQPTTARVYSAAAARCFRPPPALLPRPSRRRRHPFPPPPQTIRCSRYSSGRTPNSARASTHLRGTTSPSVTCAAYGRLRGRHTTRSSSSSTIDVGMAGVSMVVCDEPSRRCRTRVIFASSDGTHCYSILMIPSPSPPPGPTFRFGQDYLVPFPGYPGVLSTEADAKAGSG
jgi:hypothetical protein